MPFEKIFDFDGVDVSLGWAKGGEAKAVVRWDGKVEKIISESEFDHLEAILRRVRKQVFGYTSLDVLLDSKTMTKIAQNTPSFWETIPQGITGHVKRVPWPYPSAAWEVNPGKSQETASWIYMREKVAVSSTTMLWNRKAQRKENGELPVTERQNLEKSFIRDLSTLTERFDNFVELILRQALFGRIIHNYADVYMDLDYRFTDPVKAQHPWKNSETSLTKIKDDITKLVTNYQKVNDNMKPTHAYCHQSILNTLVSKEGYSIAGPNVPNSEAYIVPKSSMRIVPGMPLEFMDILWSPVDMLIPGQGLHTVNHAEGKIAFVNWDNKPLHLLEGPSMDFDATDQHTGKFSKGWTAHDPHCSQILCEYSFMPAWVDKNAVSILDVA